MQGWTSAEEVAGETERAGEQGWSHVTHAEQIDGQIDKTVSVGGARLH